MTPPPEAAPEGAASGRYRRRPVVIDAFRLGLDPWPDWAWALVTSNDIIIHGEWKHLTHAQIRTSGSVVKAQRGQWIIRGEDAIGVCSDEHFRDEYEAVPPDHPTAPTAEELASWERHAAALTGAPGCPCPGCTGAIALRSAVPRLIAVLREAQTDRDAATARAERYRAALERIGIGGCFWARLDKPKCDEAKPPMCASCIARKALEDPANGND
jgi:hypothetical protein